MSPGQSSELCQMKNFRQEAHLSFSSGTYLGIYHIGVVQAFKDFAPQFTKRRVLGSSAGALAASCVVCNVPLEKAITAITKMTVHCRSLMFGALDPRFNISRILRTELYALLPLDAHLRANDKLFIAVTRAFTLEHKLVSKFDTLDELIETLIASCFIPFFLGFIPPKLKGVRYIDGGATCRIPVLNECTITVSPIRRPRAIIKPGRDLYNMLGPSVTAYMRRLLRMIFAPSPSELIDLCRQGYDDAVDFLQSNQLILCRKCWTSGKQDNGVDITTKNHQTSDKKRSCVRCENLRVASALSRFPSVYYRSVKKAEENERSCHEVNLLTLIARARCTLLLIMVALLSHLIYKEYL